MDDDLRPNKRRKDTKGRSISLKKQIFFVYSGQPIDEIPKNVTHVTVDDSVQKIEDFAFQDCKSLQSVTIPSSVEIIGESAFLGCISLVQVHLQEGLEIICRSSFGNCFSLVHIELPIGLTQICSKAFLECRSLRSISVPGTVETIGCWAFGRCRNLVDIHFHEGLQWIQKSAFCQCHKLSGIVLPATLQMIERNAFYDCPSLLGIEVSGASMRLEEQCFKKCRALVNLSIPASVAFAWDAFENCELLRDEDGKTHFRERHAHSLVHHVCYHSSSSTLTDLREAFESSDMFDIDNLKDAYGMTPLHIVATSPNPRVDCLEYLLDRYPRKSIEHRDDRGKTMLDYLLMHTSSKAIPLIQMVLQKALVERISYWGLRGKPLLALEHPIESMTLDDGTERRQTRVHEALNCAGYCTKLQATSLLELALWKRRIKEVQMDYSDCEIDRASCRCQCGSEVVLENVSAFVWGAGESRVATSLAIFPLCWERR